MVRIVLESDNHVTGVSPNRRSRTVPPPMAVTNERINTPNGSSLFSIAARAPATAK